MGYSLSQNAYLCFEPSTTKIITSQHVIFHEGSFPFHQPDHNSSLPSPSVGQHSSVMISLPKLSFASPSPSTSPDVGTEVLPSSKHGSPSTPSPL